MNTFRKIEWADDVVNSVKSFKAAIKVKYVIEEK